MADEQKSQDEKTVDEIARLLAERPLLMNQIALSLYIDFLYHLVKADAEERITFFKRQL